MAAAQLPRDPIPPPPARLQPQHLRYVVRRLHHLPPWIAPRRAFRDSLLVHSLSPQLSQGGAIPRDAEGAIFHGARHSFLTRTATTDSCHARITESHSRLLIQADSSTFHKWATLFPNLTAAGDRRRRRARRDAIDSDALAATDLAK